MRVYSFLSKLHRLTLMVLCSAACMCSWHVCARPCMQRCTHLIPYCMCAILHSSAAHYFRTSFFCQKGEEGMCVSSRLRFPGLFLSPDHKSHVCVSGFLVPLRDRLAKGNPPSSEVPPSEYLTECTRIPEEFQRGSAEESKDQRYKT